MNSQRCKIILLITDKKTFSPFGLKPLAGSGGSLAVQFCDHHCRFASWPEKDSLDGSGSCRTFQAVYCGKKKKLVQKNMPCPEKETRIDSSGKS
jgi:hypothetical protein